MNALGQLIGVLFVVGLIIRYFWLIVLVVAAWFAYRWGRAAWARHCADADAWAAEQKAVAARAERQHRWALAGDPRGTYGDYPPAA